MNDVCFLEKLQGVAVSVGVQVDLLEGRPDRSSLSLRYMVCGAKDSRVVLTRQAEVARRPYEAETPARRDLSLAGRVEG